MAGVFVDLGETAMSNVREFGLMLKTCTAFPDTPREEIEAQIAELNRASSVVVELDNEEDA